MPTKQLKKIKKVAVAKTNKTVSLYLIHSMETYLEAEAVETLVELQRAKQQCCCSELKVTY
jgi:hypothetical protein